MTQSRRIALEGFAVIVSILVAFAIAATVSVVPGEVVADRRRNPLEGQPAVRHRVLLVKKRFEIVEIMT